MSDSRGLLVVLFVCHPAVSTEKLIVTCKRVAFVQDLEWVYLKLQMICLEAEGTNGH